MDTVLLLITIGALGLAISLAVVGWKLLRHDRGQLAARVEALRSLAAEPEPEIAETKTSGAEMPVFTRRAPSRPRTTKPQTGTQRSDRHCTQLTNPRRRCLGRPPLPRCPTVASSW
jgi:hypothetical protein